MEEAGVASGDSLLLCPPEPLAGGHQRVDPLRGPQRQVVDRPGGQRGSTQTGHPGRIVAPPGPAEVAGQTSTGGGESDRVGRVELVDRPLDLVAQTLVRHDVSRA